LIEEKEKAEKLFDQLKALSNQWRRKIEAKTEE
jgi:hypothetical protein